jgi:RNA polymerase sigma factor (TIGR02999 family)
MNEVTRILSAIETGDPLAADRLLPLVYDELRKLAAQRLAHEKPGQTLQATALVHEAYLRLVDADEARPWDGRHHFFAAAAEAMRRILVENARRKEGHSSPIPTTRSTRGKELSNNNLNHYLITAWAKWYSSIPRGTGLSSVALPLTLRLKL